MCCIIDNKHIASSLCYLSKAITHRVYSSQKMFWIIFIFVFVASPLVINSEPACKQFKTVEVLQRFRWERSVLPLTTLDAEKEGWHYLTTVQEYSIDMYRFKDVNYVNNFFIFFYKGNLVGVGPTFNTEPEEVMPLKQYEEHVKTEGVVKPSTELIKSKAHSLAHYLSNLGTRYIFKHSVIIETIKFEYSIILFADPDILRRQAEIPCTGTTIYFEGREKNNWKQVSILENEIKEKNPEMDKQGCLDKFGNFYFYSLNDETDCKEIHGFFSFYDDHGVMSGFGLFFVGSDILMEVDNKPHPYYRFANTKEVKDMVPHNKDCIIDKPYQGYTTVNIFLKPKSETEGFKCNSEEVKQLH